MTVSAGNKKLKVLFFSQRFPYPMDTGGKIRTGKLLEQLNDLFHITLVSNVESPKDDGYLDQVKNLCAEFYPVPWKEVSKYSFKFYLKVLLGMFSRYPFTVINDYSRDLEAALRYLTTSQHFDLLVCDFLQPSLNVRNINGIPTLLFEHNIESVIPRRHFETARNPIAKVFWWLQWRKMERYEKDACRKFTGTVTVSEADKKCLEERFGIKNVFAIPTGVDTDYYAPRKDKVKKNSLVGEWAPDRDRELAHLDGARVTDRGRGQARCIDLHDGEVGQRIHAVDRALELAVVLQRDRQLVASLDHVMVCEDPAGRVEDDAGTDAFRVRERVVRRACHRVNRDDGRTDVCRRGDHGGRLIGRGRNRRGRLAGPGNRRAERGCGGHRRRRRCGGGLERARRRQRQEGSARCEDGGEE